MPTSAMPRANTSGSGSGCRPSAGDGSAASQASRSTNTASGRCPFSYASLPELPSRYHRTSASTTPSGTLATTGGNTSARRVDDDLDPLELLEVGVAGRGHRPAQSADDVHGAVGDVGRP